MVIFKLSESNPHILGIGSSIMQANIPVQAIKCCILCGNTKLRMTFSDLGHLQSWNDKKIFNPKLFWPGDVDCSIRFNMVKVFIGFIKRQKQKNLTLIGC